MLNIDGTSLSTVIASAILIMFFITNFYLYNAFKKIEKIPEIEFKVASAITQLSYVLNEVKEVLKKNQELMSTIEFHRELININKDAIHSLRVEFNNFKE